MSEVPPSDQRRREARARGEVAVSRLFTGAGALGGATVATVLSAPGGGARLQALAGRAFSGQLAIAGAMGEVLSSVARLALPVVVAAWLGAATVGLLQSGALFAPGAIGQRRREAQLPSLPWALAAALLLLGALAARAVAASLARASGVESATAVVLDVLAGLLPRAILLVLAAGLADWAWRRQRLQRTLWMTRVERERERRQEEGDPRWKAERRRRHRALVGSDKP